jgi:hypothetical protein
MEGRIIAIPDIGPGFMCMQIRAELILTVLMFSQTADLRPSWNGWLRKRESDFLEINAQ